MPVTPLESHIGYWLRYVSNHVSHRLGVQFAAHEVTVAEWVILREIYAHERMVQSRVAQLLGMTRGAVSKLTDRLVNKAFVTRSTNESDRRYQALALTAAGRELVPKLSALVDENEEAFFGSFGSDERAQIEGFMKEIARRAGLQAAPPQTGSFDSADT